METKLSLDLNELSLLMDQASFIESNTTVRFVFFLNNFDIKAKKYDTIGERNVLQ